MAYLRLFYRLIVRPLLREPWRSGLTVFAVSLGVAVVLAIELAGNAAAGSFQSSLETLAGNTNLEVTASGGVPDEIVGILARLPYPIQIHPRIEDYAVLVDTRTTVPVIGLDLISESNNESAQNFHAQVAPGSEDPGTLTPDDSIWVGSSLGKRAGDRLQLLMNDHTREYTVRGVFDDRKEGVSPIVIDIAAAQRELGRIGRVDRVLLRVPAEPSLAAWQSKIGNTLPEGVQVKLEGSGTAENRRMLGAFRWNLRILSYVALVVGAFLIYNTISVSVVQRRPEIGILRALGASRRAVLLAFLGEAVCFGFLGALLALPLGRAMASAAVRLLSATVQSLYVSSRPGALALTGWSVALASGSGIVLATLSALSPAREASMVSPVEAMARGRREYVARVQKGRDLLLALALGITSALTSRLPAVAGKPLFGYLSAILLIGASVFAIPALVDLVSRTSSQLLGLVFGVEALLAARSLAGSLRRTSVLVGALATAVAMMTSVAIMVGSFRQTVLVWMDDQLPADLYLRPAGQEAADRHPTIAPEFADALLQLPGVSAVDRYRAYEISYHNSPVTLAGADLRVMRDFRKSDFLSGTQPNEVLAQLQEPDTAIISEPFSNKYKVLRGQKINVPMGRRLVALRVVDVYYDYASERGVITVSRENLLRYLPDPAPSNVAVYARPGTDLDRLRQQIEKAAAGRNILLFSNRDLRNEAIQVFDRTFAITYALEAVAIVVAVMGIAGALLALVIDRRRELSLLRFLGAARVQIWKIILTEAGLLGLLANIAGLSLGFFLSLVLIYVINKQSFGWTIQFHWPVAVLMGALTVVYVATVLAGIYPARIATSLNPIEVIHEE